MILQESTREETHRTPLWPWRIGLVTESAELTGEITAALQDFRAECAFRVRPGAPALEIASLVERERPGVLIVELARVSGSPAEWIASARSGGDLPLVVAVHPESDPVVMIGAMRAGASEFVSLPVRPSIFEALDRVATLLESRRSVSAVRGKMVAVLSAKGGCGATSVACHVAAALRLSTSSGRILVADLDAQSPAVHRVLRVSPSRRVGDAFDAVRRLNAACWPDFAASADENLDALGGWDLAGGDAPPMPEPWRIESLFRFLTRNYAWVLADLGRQLNPAVWTFLQNVDELYIVTAPDVLALYQTRSILQTLSGRGFDRSRVRLVLNRNLAGPRDFWIESIEKMFELGVAGVIPDDHAALGRLPRDRFEFPANSPFGRAIVKLANRMSKPPGGSDSGKKAA
jgi:pilus assembly protein CpaE